MSVSSLIARLKELDIGIQWVDGKLKLNAPEELLTPGLIAELKEKKKELGAFLQKKLQKQVRYSAIEPSEKKEYYVLSSPQKRLYILHQVEAGNISYNMLNVSWLTGDIKALERVLKKVIARHESFRTSFEMTTGGPVQRIHEQVDFKIENYPIQIDDSKQIPNHKLPLTNEDQAVENLIKNFSRAFDLSRAPLLRVGLSNVGEGRYILLIDMPHIISDGISTGIIIDELAARYADPGREPAPLRLQYKDYAEWQQRRRATEALQQQEEYWLRQFNGEIPVLNLFTDYPRPAVQDFTGAVTRFELGMEETRGLNELALNHGTTLFTVLLAAVEIFLSRLSGQDDIVVGTPTAGRRHADLQDIIGMFVNTLAIRGHLPGEKTVAAFLAESKQNTLDAFENQDYPFEELVEKTAAAGNRDTGRNPLFDILFVLQNIDIPVLEIPGLTLAPYEYETAATRFDLTLQAVEGEEHLYFSFEYCGKLFKKETIRRWTGYFKQVVDSMLKDPRRKLAGIEIIPREEKERLLYEFNAGDRDYPTAKTIHGLVEEQVERTPDRIALKGPKLQTPNRQWQTNEAHRMAITYRELHEKSARLAVALREKGIHPGTIVGIMVERSAALPVALLAILKTGSAYLPMDPESPGERLDYMLADSSAKVRLTANSTGTLAEKGEHGTMRKGEERKRGRWEGETICLDTIDDKTPAAVPAPAGLKKLPLPHSPLAYVIYTSGTTGQPKGVPVKHQGFINLIYFHRRIFGETPASRMSQVASPGFDAMAFEVWPCLTAGAALVIADNETRVHPAQMKQWLIKEQITISFQPTALAEQLLKEKWAESGTALKALRCAGDRLTRYPAQHCPFTLYNLYGPTEDTVWTTWAEIPPDPGTGDFPVLGKPIANHYLRIAAANLELQPIGIPGELCIEGIGLSSGYLNRPELTAEKFCLRRVRGADTLLGGLFSRKLPPWTPRKSFLYEKFLEGPGNLFSKRFPGRRRQRRYKTGDLARWLPEGNIEFLGRIDTQVKIRGYRIELGEIENRLIRHEEIKEAVVIPGEEPPGGGRFLCAYFVPRHEKPLPAKELREYLSTHLPGYMIPSYFVPVEEIPLTPAGKVNRQALPAPGFEAGEDYVPPRNELEQKLAEIWQEVLGPGSETLKTTLTRETPAPGLDDNFFQRGGHSLKAALLATKIHKELHVKISLAEIFKRATIRGLAEYIKIAAVKAGFAPLEAAEEKEYYPLSSPQQGLYLLQQLDPGSIAYNTPTIVEPEEKIDEVRLEEAFRGLVKRHESLRTRFEMEAGQPVQKIRAAVDFNLENYDLTAEKPERDRQEKNTGKKTGDTISAFIRPFDLSRAPLLRVGLITNGPAKHILMLDMHHIVTDGTSQTLLIKDVMAFYAGKELTRLKIRYRDFSEWRNSRKEREKVKRHEDYWLRQLEGELPVLQLPTDFPHPPVQDFAGNTLRFQIGAEETDGLKLLALDEGVTLYMVLLAISNIMLSKISRQYDIVVGTPTAGRPHADLAQVVGMFVNTLPMRNYPQPGKTVNRFLKEVKENTVNAFENQDYFSENRVNRLVKTVDTSRNKLYSVMFALQNLDFSPGGSGGQTPGEPALKVKPYEYRNTTAKFDLNFQAIEDENRLSITVEYSSTLFLEETVRRICHYFREILSRILQERAIKLEDIDMMTEEEKKQVLLDFNETGFAHPGNKTLHGLFREQVERTPDHIAIAGDRQSTVVKRKNRHLSYGELKEKSTGLAYGLLERGVEPDTPVGIMVERSLEMVIGIFGILKAGGAYLPIDPGYPRDRLDFMLKDSNAKILLTANEIAALSSPRVSNRPGAPHPPGGTSLAYVIYTSGSTGKPKGVMIEHPAVVNRLQWMQRLYPLDENDVILQKTPVIFDVSVWELFWWSITGASLYIVPPGAEREPEHLVEAIEMNKITTMHFVPSMLKVFLAYLEAAVDLKRLAGLKQVFASGEVLDLPGVEIFNRLLNQPGGTKLINLYGPTEATVDVTYFDCSPPGDFARIPIGKPIDNLRLYILSENGSPQPMGIAGELCISGVGLARGYLNNPGLTAEQFCLRRPGGLFSRKLPPWTPRKSFLYEKFLEGPGNLFSKRLPGRRRQRLYKTGDLARWLADGNIEFLGRLDHQVKVRGYRIELGEIESCLIKHEKIKEAVVLVLEAAGARDLCAYYTGVNTVHGDTLREYLSRQLPGYMVPSYFVMIEKMPLTASGKVDRAALAAMKPRREKEYTRPGNAAAEKLVQLWSDILEVDQERIGIDDNFQRWGGHSLAAIRLMTSIHKVFNVKISLAEIFALLTVRKLSEYIARAAKDRFVPLAAAEKKEYYPLSPAQKRLYVSQQMTGQSIVYNLPFVSLLQGPVDGEKMEDAFGRLIRRHDSLRTSVEMIAGELVQLIRPAADIDFAIRCIETTSPGPGEVETIIHRFIRPFDLEKAPLFRVGLVKQDRETHILMVDIHHLISDGISLDLLHNEFMALYAGLRLPPLHFQYKDCSEWQNRRTPKEKEELKRQEQFWLEEFRETPSVPDLHPDYPRPPVVEYEGKVRRFTLGEEETAALKAMALEENATLFMLLLALFNIFLWKVSGREDIVVGAVTAGRNHEDLARIIGIFINTLALRNFLSGTKRFNAFLKEVSQRAARAFANQDYPFEELVERLAAHKDTSRHPLFDVVFDFQGPDPGTGRSPGAERSPLALTPYEYENRTAKFDLVMTGREVNGKIDFIVEYRTNVFKEEKIKKYIRFFKEIVSAVVKDPGLRLQEIRLTHDLAPITPGIIEQEQGEFGF